MLPPPGVVVGTGAGSGFESLGSFGAEEGRELALTTTTPSAGFDGPTLALLAVNGTVGVLPPSAGGEGGVC